MFCFCTEKQSQKLELPWMNPFMVNLLTVKPPLLTKSCWSLARAVPGLLFLRSPGGDARVGITERLSSKRNGSPRLSLRPFPAQPCSYCCGSFKLSALLDLKGGEAGKEKLERSLERAGHCTVGSCWSEVPWYLKASISCAPFPLCITGPRYQSSLRSAMGALHGVSKMLEN